MPDLDGQRQTIATVLATVSGLRVDSEGLWPDAANLPGALVKPAADSSPMSIDMSSWYEAYEVTVLTQMSTLVRGQRTLDDFYDAVVAALISGLAGTLLNLRRAEYGVLEVDGNEYTGFTLRLEMIG